MANKMLYPKSTATRSVIDLSGMWDFKFDFENEGLKLGFKDGFKDGISIPVPSSFQDFFTDKKYKEYTGDVWYQKEFFIDEAFKNKDIDIRFFAATHRATVYLNGKEIFFHEGGFTPFSVNINKEVKFNEKNILVVKVNNELSYASLPSGHTRVLSDGRKVTEPFFDFFNYSGLIRPVKIVITPKSSILDITINHEISNNVSKTLVMTDVNDKDTKLEIEVFDKENNLVSKSEGFNTTVEIKNPKLWEVLNAYLYRFEFKLFKSGKLIDQYNLNVGIRTVKISGKRILINDKPVYFKGFGKHEDSNIAGRALNLPYAKRDFELMKWIGANSFRTSHYPYSEEIYDLADEEGFLVIDELPAVGMLVSLRNFVDAATGAKIDPFFDEEIVHKETIKNHLAVLEETVTRDKNHACVVAWSLFNEPDTVGGDKAHGYFEKVFNRCLELDIQKRPRSFAHIYNSGPETCKCTDLVDFVMLNRYYGWYSFGGVDFEKGIKILDLELTKWEKHNKPVMFTEYGCDNLAGVNTLPAVQWSENYEVDYLKEYHRIFDLHECVMGEQPWNFADFRTTEGIWRVNGNKKGVFTRDREPKMAAFYLRDRWLSLPLNHKN